MCKLFLTILLSLIEEVTRVARVLVWPKELDQTVQYRGRDVITMFFVCVVLLMFLESSNPDISSMDDIPLTKSLGYSLDKNFGNTLRDTRLSQEYIEQYQEILKVSQESVESLDEDTKWRRVVGNDNFEKGVIRRRSAFRLRSPAYRRRARSQALRKEKLNSQSLRSHIHHSKQINQYNYN